MSIALTQKTRYPLSMSNPLVPQQRIDKNGKITTRHMNAVPAVITGVPAFPSPAPQAAGGKPVKPLSRQTKKQTRMVSRKSLNSSEELLKALGKTGSEWELAVIEASEQEVLDVFSVVSIDNAVPLVESGITSSEAALEFLHNNGLDHLFEDRREMMERAIAKRVNSFDLMDLHAKFGMDNYSEDAFLGAARIKGSSMLPSLGDGTGGIPETFHEAALRGEISSDDLSELTYSTVSMHDSMKMEIYEGLKAIHHGSAAYDPALLKRMIEASTYSNNTRGVYQSALEMVEEYGPEFVRGLQRLTGAHELRSSYIEKGSEYCRKLIEYSETFNTDPYAKQRIEDIHRLYEAGIAPSDARHLAGTGMSVDQIISAHESGISTAVSTGWL